MGIYIYKAKVTEATDFLLSVQNRQENYFTEFGNYCDGQNWQAMGVEPPTSAHFQYTNVAGRVGDAVPADTGLSSDVPWFVTRAVGDLDRDGTTFTITVTSQSDGLFNSASGVGGWE